jgi:hypothetical protein
MDQAFSELTTAGISAVSIIPFGTIWNLMGKSAKVAKMGSMAKVADLALSEKTEVVEGLAKTIKELSKPELSNVLMKAKSQVTVEEYSSFIGQLSQLPKDQRELIFTRMQSRPDKLSEAMRKTAQKSAEFCR